ncbi:MAG: hypothetical protein IKK29_06190, partial [Christensenellaceae bacterium]|nr:hypothetical protein [Christensenellaceae bacterium]
LAVLIGNRDFRIFEIERDEDEIAALMKEEERFWECVKTNTPPAVDGSERTSDTITMLHPESNSAAPIDLFGYDDCLTQYLALKVQIDELTKLRDEMANRVKVYMGDSARAESDRYKVSWITQKRPNFDTKRFQKDYSQIDLSPYIKTTSSRVFRVREN